MIKCLPIETASGGILNCGPGGYSDSGFSDPLGFFADTFFLAGYGPYAQPSIGDNGILGSTTTGILGYLSGAGPLSNGDGDSQAQIIRVRRSQLTVALSNDPNCLIFLGGGALPALNSIPITATGASQAGPNAATVTTINLGGQPNYAININQSGPFFIGGFPAGGSLGGSPLIAGRPAYQALYCFTNSATLPELCNQTDHHCRNRSRIPPKPPIPRPY